MVTSIAYRKTRRGVGGGYKKNTPMAKIKYFSCFVSFMINLLTIKRAIRC